MLPSLEEQQQVSCLQKPSIVELDTKSFSDINAANKQTGSEKKSHFCHVCGRSFKYKIHVTSHLRRAHDGAQPFNCQVCGKSFFTRSELTRHEKIHNRDRSFICEMCGKSYFYQYHLTLHERSHMDEKPFICETCGESFDDQWNMSRHMTAHREIRMRGNQEGYEKPLASDNFSIKQDVKQDTILSRGKSYDCELRGKIFHEKGSYKIHLRRKHGGERHFSCLVCEKSFVLRSELTRHARLSHGHKCRNPCTCGKFFRDDRPLVMRVQEHRSERPYVCEDCGRSFTTYSTLTVHRRSHSGERPFICETCGKSFASKYLCWNHMKLHNEERPFICETCGKSFKLKKYLLSHEQIHSEEKPYSCDECGKSFKVVRGLRAHRQTHEKEKKSSHL